MSPDRRPVLVIGPLVWLAVVVVVATVTWHVIDSAGRQVLTFGGQPTLSARGTAGPGRAPATLEPTPRHGGNGRSRTPAPSPSASPSRTGTGPAPAQQTQQPERTAPPSSGPTPAPSTQPPPPSPQQAQVRTWRGSAGTVTAVCDATRIALQSVTPNDGWAFAVGDRGPEHVEVQFKTRQEGERETQVRAACETGAPRFQVETSGSGGSDGADD